MERGAIKSEKTGHLWMALNFEWVAFFCSVRLLLCRRSAAVTRPELSIEHNITVGICAIFMTSFD